VAEVALPGRTKGTAHEKFDAKGLVVAPGFIDIHVHLREPGQNYKESIATGTAALPEASLLSAACRTRNPWLIPPNGFHGSSTRSRRGSQRVPHRCRNQGQQRRGFTDFRGLQRAGAIAVTDDGKPILGDDIMRETLRLGAELNFPIIQHAEDTRVTANCSMNDGPTAFRLGLRGMKTSAEGSVVERDVQLAQQLNGARLHVAHLSTADALKAVRRGKRNKVHVTCEVAPHHFTLTGADIRDYDANFKMNPPLRSAADREALIVALGDGTVDAIATDHAPHAPQEKIIEFERAAFGITGFDTAVGLAITRLNLGAKIPLARIVELFTAGPARVLSLTGRGTLARGAHADVTIFDAKNRWTYDAAKSRSKSHNTPFDGWQLTGKVVSTIVSGRVVYSAD
jgi:dihydroorotase